MASKSKAIIFSVLFNEEPSYLGYLVNNFLSHTPVSCALIVNSGVAIGAQYMPPYNERIFIIPAEKARAKLGLSLLIGHCESFEYAKNSFEEFNFFVPIASNSLFVKTLVIDSVLTAVHAHRSPTAILSLDSPPATLDWPHYQALLPHLVGETGKFKNTLLRNNVKYLQLRQIEGLVSSFDNWERVVHVARDLEPTNIDIPVPLEEVMPVAIIAQLGDGRYAHICRNMWSKAPYNNTGNIFVDSRLLLDGISGLPDSIYLLKWFERSVSSFETWLVCTKDGILVRDSLRAILGREIAGPRLSKLANYLNELSDSAPLTRHEIRTPSSYQIRGEFEVNRSILDVNSRSGDNVGFIFFEDTKERVMLGVSNDSFGSTIIHAEPRTLDSTKTHAVESIVAYYYISLTEFKDADRLLVNMTSAESILDSDLKLWARLTLRDSRGRYTKLVLEKLSSSQFSVSMVFLMGLNVQASHIGLPVINPSNVRWSIGLEKGFAGESA